MSTMLMIVAGMVWIAAAAAALALAQAAKDGDRFQAGAGEQPTSDNGQPTTKETTK